MDDRESKPSTPPVSAMPHLRGLLFLLTLLTIYLGIRLALNRTFIDDPQPDIPARMNDLADRMDPNTATWQELAAIPGLGEKKAHSIVEFRDNWNQKHPNVPAFAKPEDLHAIKGIGPAMISNMKPYLIFPGSSRPLKSE